MASLTKKQKDNDSKIETGVRYSITDALSLIKDCATAKFDESIDISINLGIDAKKSDQNIRGAVVLPNGTGKIVRVAVFTQGDNVQKANDAGADVVGMEDLMKSMQDGDLNYDVVIASPDAMGVVGRLGQVLGPRGLMPNPKVGTVTRAQLEEVANIKMKDLNANDMDAAVQIIAGTARSMGLEVEG